MSPKFDAIINTDERNKNKEYSSINGNTVFESFGPSRDRFIIVLQRHTLPPASYNPKAIK
jgi:hypothetical protein